MKITTSNHFITFSFDASDDISNYYDDAYVTELNLKKAIEFHKKLTVAIDQLKINQKEHNQKEIERLKKELETLENDPDFLSNNS